MKCSNCQSNVREGVKFCEECGSKLEALCPACKTKIPLGTKFCGECGTKLNLFAEPIQEEISFDEKLRKIQRYLPEGLTEKILSKKEKIEGERKQVTVLFCDMKGFTPLVEKLGAESAFKAMDQIYELLIHKVHDYGGTVNEMTGDGIMALFGAPIALEDAPQRAIRSAYAIHREVTKFNENKQQSGEHLPPIKMRIGIHSGPVVIGSLGNDLRVEFKAVGDTVNTASRIEGLAEPGSTYVSENTFKLSEGFFRFEAIGEKCIKGKSEPVKIYRVIAPSTRKTRFDVSAERGLTSLVGRERELELLLDGFQRAKSGKGQAFSIVADAGLGKSRLLYEFRKAIANEDVTFLEGRCLSYSKNVAYHPVIDILKANFDIQEDDNDDDIKEKIQHGLKIIGAGESLCLPYLMELLSVKEKGFDSKRVSPGMNKDRINETLNRIAISGCEIRPLVMAFEDLHWIDKNSEDALKSWLNAISGTRALMIFTYRPEYIHTWGGKSYHNQLNLNRLSNRESLKMVNQLLCAKQIDRNFEEFILEKAEGVPFFIEEFITSLKDLNLIEHQNGTYQLSKKNAHHAIPSTIHDVIMARVDGMPEGAKEILRIGSAIEREFSFEVIKQVMRIPEKELIRHLFSLKDAELIYERGVFPKSIGIFKHALTQQVVYDSIITGKKKVIHEAVGKAIEELYAENLDEYFAILSEQYCKCENWQKCVTYSIKTGDRAAGFFAWHEARKNYEAALNHVDNIPPLQKAEVLGKLATVTMFDLDVEVSLNYALSALELFEGLSDRENQLNMLMHIQSIYTGGYLDGSKEDKAIDYLKKAAEIVENEPDTIEKGLIYQRTAHLYLHRGNPAKTIEWATKAEDLYSRIDVKLGTSIGTAKTYIGFIEEGLTYNEKNWMPVLEAGNPLIIAILGHEIALTRALCKDVPNARIWGEKILPEVTKAGQRFEGFILRPLTLIYALSGEFSKARNVCLKEAEIEKKTLMSCFFEDAAGIGFYYLRQGEWEQAEQYLEWAIGVHQERNNAAALSACYYVCGNLCLLQNHHSEAEKYLFKSLKICRSGGNLIFELWVLPAICELYIKTGNLEKASDYVESGLDLLTPNRNWFGLPGAVYLAKAMLESSLKNWNLSSQFFEKAIEINQKYELVWDEGKTHAEMAKMLLSMNRIENEKIAYAKLYLALDIYNKIGAVKNRELVLGQLDELS
jgi:class 3 adenylate cyclase/tetratricopeptide (TPR) repeat protein